MKPTMTEEERILTLEEKVARLQFDVYALQSKMDLMADRKTENSSEIPNNCDEPQLTPNYCGTCKHREVPCGDLPCDVCHGYSNYEPKDEPQTVRDENYIYAYDKDFGEWRPIQEIKPDCPWK